MKATAQEGKKHKTFPKLMIANEGTGFYEIVLITESDGRIGAGTTVCIGPEKFARLGEYRDDWCVKENFLDFHGTVSLSND